MRLKSYDYKGMGHWLMGPESREMVSHKADEAKGIYQSIVARRSGDLARSAQASVRVSNVAGRRWAGILTVGEGIDYAASHEFGTSRATAAHDLNAVLSMMRVR